MYIDLSASQFSPVIQNTKKEMISIQKINGLTKVRINSSSLSIIQECWRKAEYALVRNLKSNVESPATLFGSAIHKALEVFYSGTRKQRVIPNNFEGILSMIGCNQWDDDWDKSLLFRAVKAFVEVAQPLRSLPEGNKRSIGTGIWILENYFKTYIDDPFVVMQLDGKPIVEYKFSMPIWIDYGLEIEIFGQIDVVLQNIETGIILPCDHKTTSILGQQFYNRLNPNHQYTFYTWACNDVLGLKTESFLVNALQVKEQPKTLRGSPPQFARQVTTRTLEDFEDLRKTIVCSVKEFLKRIEDNYFPMTTPNPCASYTGCQYLTICSSPSQLKENIIAAKYQEFL
jgi:PD-(D/E)XK nuclease superfamily